eukprot:gene11759-15735_t
MQIKELLVVFLASLVLFSNGWWHAYDKRKKRPNDEYCKNKTISHTIHNKQIKAWKLWPSLFNKFDEDNGETVAGYTEVMRTIWENQHPKDCSKAKFLIAEGWTQGFGSEVHIIGVGLALAMNLNRVYVMNPDGPLRSTVELDNRWQVRNPFCESQNKKTLECYYEPWTNCSIDDILGGKTIKELKEDRENTYTSDTDLFHKKFVNFKARTILMESRADVPYAIPNTFKRLLDCSPVQSHFYFYWWRAVSASYILRPNQATLDMIMKYKNEDKVLSQFNHESQTCTSVYIRRGDKHVEVDLTDNKIYFTMVKRLHEKMSHNITLKPKNNNILFVGSEDPGAINDAIEWGKHHNWNIMYSNLFDRSKVSTYLNHSQQEVLKKNQKFIHHNLEYFSMIFNLDMHLHCNSFVCMTASNFCRLIDELRSTVANKANALFADVTGDCTHCINKDFQYLR